MTRRPTGRGRRPMQSARRRGAGGGYVDPTSDPLSLLWWDPTVVSGAVASWVDSINAIVAEQATADKRPVASLTAIGGAYPGVTGDGVDDVLSVGAAGAVLGGKSKLTLTAAMVDSESTSVKAALELTTNSTVTNGSLAVFVNHNAAPAVNGVIRGTSGFTERYAGEGLSSVKVVSIGYDFAAAGAPALPFIRINGVAQSLTNQSTGSAEDAAAVAAMYLFGRSTGPSLPWAGTFGDVLFRESVDEDAMLAAHERFIGARVGLTF